MTPSDPTGPGDPLDPIVADYLQQVEAGKKPDRDALLAAHPDLADRLRAFFADLDRVGRQASAFRLPDPDSTVGDGGSSDLPRVRYLGDYELLEEIARGGMGVVYKARQVSLNRVVALKLILAGTYASEAAIQRFKAEAEAAASLDHPNILPIHEIGDHEGHQFFSMKLVSGGNLGDTIGALKTRPREAAALLETLARAVHFAHQRGILHRDLKPANVLIAEDGTLYVSDFGLAKKVGGDDGGTRTGAVVGTPAYMAPEQARGAKGLTIAVDVYSLGAILYEAITGRPPFRGDTVLDTLRLVTDTEPAHPQSVFPAADRDLSVLALKCLEKDPVRRYPSAEALADELKRWLNGEPIEARPATPIERTRKWVRRNPLVAALAGMAAVGVVGLLGFLVLALGLAAEAIQGQADAQKARNDAVEAQQATDAAKDLSDRRLYAAPTVLAQSALEQVQVRQARQALEAADPARRGWEWGYLNWAVDTSRATVPDASGLKKAMRFSADGKHLFWASDEGLVRLDVARPDKTVYWTRDVELITVTSDAPTPHLAVTPDLSCAAVYKRTGLHILSGRSGEFIPLGPPRKAPGGLDYFKGAVAFSADGRHLYSAGERRLTCWTVPAGERVWEMALEFESATVVAVSPAEDRVAVGVADKRFVHVIDVAKKAEAFHTAWDANDSAAAEFTPDGKYLVTHCSFQNPRFWEVATGKLVPLEHTASWASRYAVSRDGRVGVMGMSNGDVVTFDVATRKTRHLSRGHTNYVNAVAFSPDGTLVASAGRDRTVRIWGVADGRLRDLFLGHDETVTTLAFSPDGKTLATGGGERAVKFWDLDGVRPTSQFPKDGYDVEAWHLMRDGRHLLLAQPQQKKPGPVDVWDVDAGRVVRTIVPPGDQTGGGVTSLALAADERWLVTGTREGTVHLWDFKAGTQVWSHVLREPNTYPEPGPPEVQTVALSPDGSRCAYGRPDGVVSIRDRKTGAEVWTASQEAPKGFDTFSPHRRSSVRAVRFSPDGTRVLMRWWWHQSRFTLHDAATGRRLREPVDAGREAYAAFTPDGKAVALSTKGRVVVLDLESGQEVGSIPQAKTVSALAFAPDGRRLAMGLYDRNWSDATIEVADVESGKVAFEARGHGSRVSALAYLPDGSRFVSGGFDNTVKVWAAGDGQELLSLPFHTKGDDRVEHVMVSPDGTKVFATNGCPDGGSGGRNIVTVWRSK
jgi:eukaryotic-like serine/threonine-protein kinase